VRRRHCRHCSGISSLLDGNQCSEGPSNAALACGIDRRSSSPVVPATPRRRSPDLSAITMGIRLSKTDHIRTKAEETWSEWSLESEQFCSDIRTWTCNFCHRRGFARPPGAGNAAVRDAFKQAALFAKRLDAFLIELDDDVLSVLTLERRRATCPLWSRIVALVGTTNLTVSRVRSWPGRLEHHRGAVGALPWQLLLHFGGAPPPSRSLPSVAVFSICLFHLFFPERAAWFRRPSTSR
jgi:hypothetical protein